MGKKKTYGVIDVLYFFSSAFMLVLLVIILYFSLKFWVANFNPNFPMDILSYYIAQAIVIVSVLGRWIEGRLKAIIRYLNKIGGVNGRKGRKGNEKQRVHSS